MLCKGIFLFSILFLSESIDAGELIDKPVRATKFIAKPMQTYISRNGGVRYALKIVAAQCYRLFAHDNKHCWYHDSGGLYQLCIAYIAPFLVVPGDIMGGSVQVNNVDTEEIDGILRLCGVVTAYRQFATFPPQITSVRDSKDLEYVRAYLRTKHFMELLQSFPPITFTYDRYTDACGIKERRLIDSSYEPLVVTEEHFGAQSSLTPLQLSTDLQRVVAQNEQLPHMIRIWYPYDKPVAMKGALPRELHLKPQKAGSEYVLSYLYAQDADEKDSKSSHALYWYRKGMLYRSSVKSSLMEMGVAGEACYSIGKAWRVESLPKRLKIFDMIYSERAMVEKEAACRAQALLNFFDPQQGLLRTGGKPFEDSSLRDIDGSYPHPSRS